MTSFLQQLACGKKVPREMSSRVCVGGEGVWVGGTLVSEGGWVGGTRVWV